MSSEGGMPAETAGVDPCGDGRRPEIPVCRQYMSAWMAQAVAYDGVDPSTDPEWAASGASSPEEYGFWSRRACGMACLRSILLHRDGSAPLLLELVRMAREAGAYEVLPGGRVHGLVYAPFVAMVRSRFGLDAAVRGTLTLDALRAELAAGHLVVASVHKEIRRPERPPPGRGGHLVLVVGDASGELWFRNPSGHTPETRDAHLAHATFDGFYAGRGVVVRP